MVEFKKATKKQAKLRLAIFGPSGSGKTFSCMRMATGMGGKIAVIDTERGRASKYSDRFEFDVYELPVKDVNSYIEAIEAAHSYDILIIDSISHEWEALREWVNNVAQAKYSSNKWSAWSEGTPKHTRFIDAMLDFPGHLFVTIRSKTEWTQEQTKSGKMKPVRVGLAPQQRPGTEYEFDLLMQIDMNHVAHCITDHTGVFQDAEIERPDEEVGKKFVGWLSEGEAVTEPNKRDQLIAQISEAKKAAEGRGVPEDEIKDAIEKASGGNSSKDCTVPQLRKVLSTLKAVQPKPPRPEPGVDGSGTSRLDEAIGDDDGLF